MPERRVVKKVIVEEDDENGEEGAKLNPNPIDGMRC